MSVAVWSLGSSESSLNCDLTDNYYRWRNHLKALREPSRHDSVGGEALFRGHVSGAEEVLCHSEDKAAKKQEGMHLDLQQM